MIQVQIVVTLQDTLSNEEQQTDEVSNDEQNITEADSETAATDGQ
jgi:hypothetical protein